MPTLNYRLGAFEPGGQGRRHRGARSDARPDEGLLRLLGALQEGRAHRGEGREPPARPRDHVPGQGARGLRSARTATGSIPSTAGPSTSPSPRSASTSARRPHRHLQVERDVQLPRRWTRCRSAPPSPGRWSASSTASSPWRTPAGVPLRFHDADGVVKLIEMIAYRQGIGDLLAEGSLRAAKRLGRGSEAYLTTIKGMEMAMHDPRHMPVMRASYLLAPTGGDHMRQTEQSQRPPQPGRALPLPRLRRPAVARHPERGHRLGRHARGDGDAGPSRASRWPGSSTCARA